MHLDPLVPVLLMVPFWAAWLSLAIASRKGGRQ